MPRPARSSLAPPEERFTALFDAHHPAVLGYALRRTTDAHDAADVVAEVFLVAWRRIEDAPVGDELRLWLYGVARRVLANQRRSDARRTALADRLRDHLDAATAEHLAPIRDDLAAALATLGDDDREVLLLAAWEGLTPQEIAVALGLRGTTVRSRLHRARKRLRQALDEAASLTIPERQLVTEAKR